MTHQPYADRREPNHLSHIDEVHPGFVRQIMNGLGGLLVLTLTGVVIVALVLWKSP